MAESSGLDGCLNVNYSGGKCVCLLIIWQALYGKLCMYTAAVGKGM